MPVPGSARGDVLVPLADVWHPSNAQEGSFSAVGSALFNTALSSVSAALSRQARPAAAGSGFLRAKRRESLLAHTLSRFPNLRSAP